VVLHFEDDPVHELLWAELIWKSLVAACLLFSLSACSLAFMLRITA